MFLRCLFNRQAISVVVELWMASVNPSYKMRVPEPLRRYFVGQVFLFPAVNSLAVHELSSDTSTIL